MIGLEKALEWTERGWMPDWICRQGIRQLLVQRLWQESHISPSHERGQIRALAQKLKDSPIALHTRAANEQHYELPPEFFEKVLGRRLKYSSCYWPEGTSTLDEAEAAMLRLSATKAELADGQRILELGCGWGSMTLWMAQHYPNAEILAMSNSAVQRSFIESRLASLGVKNVEIVTADMNTFTTDRAFDRVVSIEMFEHMRNYQELLSRIAGWLLPTGLLFVHIFCHRKYAYVFETEGAHNWMGRHFFTGGLMPSADLLTHFQDDLELEEHWEVNGLHYAKTARAWLENLDHHEAPIEKILAETYGEEEMIRWKVRWRLFFMACEELFGYRNGHEWQVAHYRFRK